MEYRLLGRTGVRVSSLCFGTMSFGDTADEEVSAQLFHRCRDVGINFFDCADIYSGGRSEEILGKLIRGCRDDLVITSKVFGRTGPDVNARGLSRRYILRAVEASLRRLNTDRIDIYFVHHADPDTPIDETLEALDLVVRQGKVIYTGVSNWPAWQTAKALTISQFRGLARFQCMQPMYNLVKRQAEVELLPLAQHEQLGVIPYGPLGGGLLSGKYSKHHKPADGRLVRSEMYRKRYAEPVYFEIAERFTEYAQQRGYNPAALAIAWVMSHPAVTAPIIGARTVEQLESCLQALAIHLTPEERAEISSLSPEPPPPHDRTEMVSRWAGPDRGEALGAS